MKIRNGYVSNSSSSSFLVPVEIKGRISSIKLPKEIWKAIEKNHVEWNGEKFDMSSSDEWWLTELISDCEEQYDTISKIEHAIPYLEGNDEPYGCYDEDGDKNYIKFKKDGQNFYVLTTDFINERGGDDIPDSITLRDAAQKIFNTKSFNKTQKLNALRFLFNF